MKKIILMVGLTLLGGGFILTSCKKDTGSGTTVKVAKYHCPMHPTYTSDRPGDCPICGMRLVPITESDHNQAVAETDEKSLPDRAAVKITPEREQLIGVRTAVVEERILINVIRASGRVAYDPDLYNAIVEYREALSAREKVKESPWPDVRERSDALVRSSVLRLRQMGLSQPQIDRLARAESDPTNLLLSQPDGSVWIYAQVYEYEAGQIKAGQAMEVKTAAFPGRTFRGQVVAVDTILDPQTRTLKVRGEAPTQGGLLKPEMYVDVEIEANLGTKLAIPQEAVLNTGERKIAFVKTGPGIYAPRELTLGHESKKYFEVLSGLEKGEEVVTSANFLIDSESRLKAALSGAGAHSH